VLPAKLILNLRYLLSRSLRRDLRLILLTIHCCLFRKQCDPDLIERRLGVGVLT